MHPMCKCKASPIHTMLRGIPYSSRHVRDLVDCSLWNAPSIKRGVLISVTKGTKYLGELNFIGIRSDFNCNYFLVVNSGLVYDTPLAATYMYNVKCIAPLLLQYL